MNIKYISYFFSGLFLFLLLSSCGDNNTTTNYDSTSKDAQIYSFGIAAIAPKSSDSLLRAQDSIRFIQVNKTKFAIDQVGGVIYNPDSLPYGTVLKKVKLTVTFSPTSSPSKVFITTPDSINGYSWNLTDSVSLGKLPIKFAITSQAGTIKSYDIDIRTHKIDPDTMLWTQMSSYPASIGESKTILYNNKFYTYGLGTGTPVLYTGDKESPNWAKQTLSGLPATMRPGCIFVMNNVFYTVDRTGNSYKSADGKAWTSVTNGKIITSVLGVVPGITRAEDQLLVTYTTGGKFYFGTTKDMATITDALSSNNEVSANFPLQQAASYTNFSTDKNQRMLVLTGGVASTGASLPYTWLIKNTVSGIQMSSFMKNSFFSGAGLSNFAYGSNLYALSNNKFYISTLWGELWSVAPNKQKLDTRISPRTGQTVIVDDENYIWVFGGTSGVASVNDVWKGRLNSLIP